MRTIPVTCYSCCQLEHKLPERGILRIPRILRKRTTDGAVTAGQRLTIRKYVARETLQKPWVMITKDYSLAFKLTVDNFNSIRANSLLLDTGATATILNDKSTFLNFDDNFNPENHYIELADGSRECGIVSAKGRAKVLLHDLESVPHDVFLEDAYLAICRTYFMSKQQSLREVP